MRVEYSSDKFINLPTAVVVNRDWSGAKITASENNGWLIIASETFTLRYRVGTGKFTSENLKISWHYEDCSRTWVLGDQDSLNLGGVTTLDQVSGRTLPRTPPGILSKSGYFLLDDSKTPLMDTKSDWVIPRPDTSDQDWYFFVYGHDYSHALKEFSELCGKIPMIPRYTWGIWMTDLNFEYLQGSDLVTKYKFTSHDLENEIRRFRSEGLPLDILVLDFGWHNFGWQGGYDWSPLFSDPTAFLSMLHKEGIHVGVNDHPKGAGESAVSNEDSHAREVKRLLGMSLMPKPTFVLSFPGDWRFCTDPSDTGMRASWFSKDFQDSSWDLLNGGKPWEEQGHSGYHGLGWYRKWVEVPEKSPKRLYLVLGGAADQYDLYINGEKVASHISVGNRFYNTLTCTDVSNFVEKGKPNLIALRIRDWSDYGGLTKLPVEISDEAPPGLLEFNLADKRQAATFMNALHASVMKQGVDFWWCDGSGSCPIKGLDSQLWTNRIYYDFTRSFTKKRGFILSRYAGWGSERYPIFVTGDTQSEWPMLAYQVGFTARGGNVLMPYLSHDIGGFLGGTLSSRLYCRWLEFGVFSPIFRLHCVIERPSDGNLRMPWVYGDTGVNVARKYFNLRERLIPYIYTYSRIAYDDALPIVRPLYLLYPNLEKAYSFPNEYIFGSEFIVAPVVDSSDEATVYLPPGKWVDYFTGTTYEGDRTLTVKYPIDSMPLFVKAGSIIPLQQKMSYSYERPADTLTIQVFGPQTGNFHLYEDDGLSFDYTHGRFAWTTISFSDEGNEAYNLSIGPAKGSFKGQGSMRAYRLEIHGVSEPKKMLLNGREISSTMQETGSYFWDNRKSLLNIFVPRSDIRKKISVEIM
jgi:alpha-glucosidase (family GH31 glycosyl hydrolase)